MLKWESILHNSHVKIATWQVCSHEGDIKGMYILGTYVHVIIVTSYSNFRKIQICLIRITKYYFLQPSVAKYSIGY